MQIFYTVPKAKNRKIKSEKSFNFWLFTLRRRVYEDEPSFWEENRKLIITFGLIAAASTLMVLAESELLKLLIAFIFALAFAFNMMKSNPQTLVMIGLDEASHYLVLASLVESFFGKTLQTEHLDIHEIDSVSEGLIHLKTGETYELPEIDNAMATEMMTAIQKLINASGGKAPEQREKQSLREEWLNN